MAENKFDKILKILNPKSIVFFENDMVLTSKWIHLSEKNRKGFPNTILSDLIIMRDTDIELINGKLNDLKLNSLARNLVDFVSEFNSVKKQDVEFSENFLFGEVEAFLFEIQLENKLYDKARVLFLSCVNELKKIEEDEQILELLNTYGLGVHYPNIYRDIELYIKNFEISIRVFKDFYQNKTEETKEIISQSFALNEFCICIIDNLFNAEYKANLIIEFIKNKLSERNIICIVYSSKDDKKYDAFSGDYYIAYASKEGSVLNNISDALALGSYGYIFNGLKVINQRMINASTNISLKNPQNMVYLASMAKAEGITAFDVINNWFDLAMKKSLSQMIKDEDELYKLIIKLTSILNDTSFNYEAIIDEKMESEIQKFYTFEMFDYTVNERHCPPAPGDIFVLDANYFSIGQVEFLILMGQECDLIVRDNKRNSKNAEFLNATFSNNKILEKVKVLDNKVIFNNFENTLTNSYGTLNVNLGKPKVFDYEIIDLCTINNNGECNFILDKDLNLEIKELLPEAWKSYLFKLRKKYARIYKVRQCMDSEKLDPKSVFNNDATAFQFTYNKDENRINFPMKRLCRIKDEFKDLLMKQYRDYKGRKGVNTIVFFNTDILYISYIDIGYPGQEFIRYDFSFKLTLQKTNQREVNRNILTIPWLIELDSLSRQITEQLGRDISFDNHSTIVMEPDTYESSFGISKSSCKRCNYRDYPECTQNCQNCTHELTNEVMYGLRIVIPYKINTRRIYKEEVLLTDLVEIKQLETINVLKVMFESSGEELTLADSDGNMKLININEDLSRGILLYEHNIKIKQENGLISIEEIHDAAATKEKSYLESK